MPTGGRSRQTIVIVDGDTVRSRLLSPREAARRRVPRQLQAADHLQRRLRPHGRRRRGPCGAVAGRAHPGVGLAGRGSNTPRRLRKARLHPRLPRRPSSQGRGARGAARGRLTMPRVSASPPIPFAGSRRGSSATRLCRPASFGSSAPWAISRPAVTPGRGIRPFPAR